MRCWPKQSGKSLFQVIAFAKRWLEYALFLMLAQVEGMGSDVEVQKIVWFRGLSKVG